MLAGSGFQFRPPSKVAELILPNDPPDCPELDHDVVKGLVLGTIATIGEDSQGAVVVGKPVAKRPSVPVRFRSLSDVVDRSVSEHSHCMEQPKLVEDFAELAAHEDAMRMASSRHVGKQVKGNSIVVRQDDLKAADQVRRNTQPGLEADVETAAKDVWRLLVAESWAELRRHERGNSMAAEKDANCQEQPADTDVSAMAETNEGKAANSRSRFWQTNRDKGKMRTSEDRGDEKETASSKKVAGSNQFDIPQTFKEMCALNATMIGANAQYISIIEEGFDSLVDATVKGDDGRLELQANIVALRMHREVRGDFRLHDFKVCMLASLRSLIPKAWSIAHEQAWTNMWENVQNLLTANLDLPAKYERAVENLVTQMPADEQKKFGLNAFNRLFAAQPRSENHFNTSNARLSTLASRALGMTMELYRDPARMVNESRSLGLRHTMFNISTSYFEPFVTALVEELKTWTTDIVAVDGVEWALSQIACIMVYEINENSTPLLMACVANNPKAVRKALSQIPRKHRAAACCDNLAAAFGSGK
jgi:hypothetical protein